MFQFRNLIPRHYSFTVSLHECPLCIFHLMVTLLVFGFAFVKLFVGTIQSFRNLFGLLDVILCFLGDFFGLSYHILLQLVAHGFCHYLVLASLETHLLEE